MGTNAKFNFTILTSSGVPIYRQIIDQVKTQIATGRFQKNEFLPSVRQVAAELEINPMTVSKAYSILEREGTLEFVRGQGMRVVAGKIPQQDHKGREEQIVPLLKEVVGKAAQLSLSLEQIVARLKTLWEDRHE